MTVAEYTIEMFKQDFPEFADASFDAKITTALELAPPNFDEAVWGDQLRDGLGHWIAFRVALKGQIATYGAGFASAASSSEEKTVGKVSVKRSQSQSTSQQKGPLSIYGKNAYGQIYLDLVALVGAGAAAV